MECKHSTTSCKTKVTSTGKGLTFHLLPGSDLFDFYWNFSFEPSQADNAVFDAMKKAPDGDLFHAVRWYTHIHSFSEHERKAFAASSLKLESSAGAKETKPAADDDDEVDLFGDDDEEESAEQQRIKEERLAMYAKKKEGSELIENNPMFIRAESFIK